MTISLLIAVLSLAVATTWAQQPPDPSIINQNIDDLFKPTVKPTQKPADSGVFGDGFVEVTRGPLESLAAVDRCGEETDKGVHLCVPYFNCDGVTNMIITPPTEGEPEGNTNGIGIIDIRIGANTCDNYLDVCCTIPPTGVPVTTARPIIPPEPTEAPDTGTGTGGTDAGTPPTPNHCGIRNPDGIDFKITGHSHNEAEYGEFPWMTAILKRNYDPRGNETLAICGGAIITPTVIMTGAHCVQKYKIGDLKIRAGEWDTQTTSERIPYQERNLVDIIIHPEYHAQALYNDVALLILDRPLAKADNLGTICLPNQGTVFTSRNCFASGWGKDVFGQEGQYQVILKKRELPIVQRLQCQQDLRKTRLGKKFLLHESFICAGGEGKDTCTGDGGSPLVCPDPQNPGRYMLTGIVAWGIGCNEHNVPGVYADVSQFRSWVDQHLNRLQIDNRPYLI